MQRVAKARVIAIAAKPARQAIGWADECHVRRKRFLAQLQSREMTSLYLQTNRSKELLNRITAKEILRYYDVALMSMEPMSLGRVCILFPTIFGSVFPI